MATEDLFIIAIEIGSSSVTGIAAKKSPDGTISVQAVHREPSSSFVRRGMIYNMTRSVQTISSIKERLEERIKRNITQVYVGFGGQSVYTVFNKVSRAFGSEIRVSKEILEELLNENLQMEIGNKTILDTIPQEFMAGKDRTNLPEGNIADRIEGKYLNIVARSSLRTNVENCFAEAGIHVVSYKLTALCEANSILTDSEKRSGCVLVDFGADTTTVVVFKDNLLRFISVIPLGSDNITKDLASRQLEKDEAESLKINQGSAEMEFATPEEADFVIKKLPDGSDLTRKIFGEIIEARTKEILINVAKQIKDSGIDLGALIGGAVLTGGGSNLRNLPAVFTKTTGIGQVRVAKNVPNVQFAKEPLFKDRLLGVLSILNEGTQNCCGAEQGASVSGGIFAEKEPLKPEVEPEKPEESENVDEKKKNKPRKNLFKNFTKAVKKAGQVIGWEDEVTE
ncbi:MAG: cell division protein FtsA [Bacteroidaceae bacterium]|nr:cell division protein FtsA [Bacteroidaceae bacterium]